MARPERAPVSKFQVSASGQLLIGSEAFDYHLETGGHPADVQPLGAAITDSKWEKVTGVKEVGWKLPQVAAHANFLARVHEKNPANKRSRRKLIMPSEIQFEQAAHYGMSVTVGNLKKNSGGLGKVYKESGLTARSENQRGLFEYRGMTVDQFFKIARKIARLYGGVTETTILAAHKKGWSPLHRSFILRFGSLPRLNELLGLGFDIRNWNDDDYIDWGVDVMTANGGRLPSLRAIDMHVKPEWKPSKNMISTRFGASKFRTMVEEEYEARQRVYMKAKEELLGEYSRLKLPEEWTERFGWKRKMEIVRVIRLFTCLEIREHLTLDYVLMTGQKLLKTLENTSKKSVATIETAALEIDALDILYPELKPDLTKYFVPVE